ncbi:MAG: DNA mismatch repair endonuclease MutL [Fimbriimonadales bacterium]|nr:DNA mismatch repair endonuclease MutL [Fimbriimonadales bacterium]
MPSKVALLDSHTINQIAAGEVVERPSSVVKELIENAIDAGASRIEVTIEGAGKEKIQVSDNGSGMSPEDVELALQRHATSKIRAAGDLLKVTSLGFRGEAIPSIASVSKTTITSAEEDGARTRIEVEYGQKVAQETVAGARGTDVTVERLFENTPARLKFLRTDATETSAIVELVGKYAMAYTHIAFSLRLSEHVAVQTTGSGDLLEVLSHVWGAELARSLAEIDTIVSGIRVQGFVSPPHVNKPTRSHQVLFVNGRPVRSKTMFASIDAAYRMLTPERRYPVAVLSLSIDPSEIDINVSPTKSEVKFHKEGAVFDAIRMAIKSGLMEHGLMPSVIPTFPSAQHTGAEHFGLVSLETAAIALAESESVGHLFRQPLEPEERSRFPFLDLLEDFRILGQALDTFIVATTRRGIAIIDQHVAHERVLYEYLCGLKSGAPLEEQPLLTPVPIEFDRSLALQVGEYLDDLAAIGFRIESFGANDFLVRSIPSALTSKDFMKTLRDIAEELAASGGRLRPSDAREKIWITAACRMAVKANDPLSIAEMEKLVADLAETENPYLCPHGRPITITLSYDELMRRFKRT